MAMAAGLASDTTTTGGDGGALSEPGTAAGLNEAIDVIASFVSSFEPGRYSGDDAACLLACFTRGERLCGAGKTLAATRAAESNRHRLTGHSTPAQWLAEVTGESVGDAIGVLRLGEQLDD